MLQRVTIVGSGSWATALVKLFAEKGINVSWLVRDEEQALFIRRNGYNPRYLSFARLPGEFIHPCLDAVVALHQSELILFAVPSVYLRHTLKLFEKGSLIGKRIAVSIKGLIPGAAVTPSRFICQEIDTSEVQPMVIGGPCHAEEIASQRSTYVTISSPDQEWAEMVCKSLQSHYVHTVPNDDPAGVEYAAVLKNIIGIATGIATGLHYGDNFQAVLVSNAMREADHFLQTIHPRNRDIFHSAYMGDLLVTAYSDHSRNRTLGRLVGRGLAVGKALQGMEMVAEGYNASKELAPLVKQSGLKMPVINTVHRVLHQYANPFHEFKLLEEQLS